MKCMEIDQNYLQTGTDIGCHASPEHQLRFLATISYLRDTVK